MPSCELDNYKDRCSKRKEKEKKLIAKGINSKSNKFQKLLYRGGW